MLVLALLAVSSVAQLWILYAVAFGYGVLGTVIGSAQSGLPRDLLPDQDLAVANSALSTIDQGLRILGPLVGAGIYAAYGGGSLAVLACGTFLAATVALLTVRVTESDPRAHPREHFRREFTAGFRHVRATPQLLRLVLAVAVAFAVLGTYDSIVFAVVDQGLGREPAFFGVLMSLQGGGSIVGGLTAALLVRRLGETRAVGLAFVTFALSSTGFAASSLTVVAPAAVLAVWPSRGHRRVRHRPATAHATPPPGPGECGHDPVDERPPDGVHRARRRSDQRRGLPAAHRGHVGRDCGQWSVAAAPPRRLLGGPAPGARRRTANTTNCARNARPAAPHHPFDDSYREVTEGLGILHTVRCCL